MNVSEINPAYEESEEEAEAWGRLSDQIGDPDEVLDGPDSPANPGGPAFDELVGIVDQQGTEIKEP